MRVAMIASECEPWAKTGGLADVVDALARALGRLPGGPEGRVDVYLPRYRGVPVPDDRVEARSTLDVPDPRARYGLTEVGLVDVGANGYRLRLVDHPPAFDRDGYYGDALGDYPDNAWRFGLFCRTALEAIRQSGGVDVLHLHDWHAAPALLLRDGPYGGDTLLGPAATLLTIHNLAYHGWVPTEQIWALGLEPTVVDPGAASQTVAGHRPRERSAEHGLDLLRSAIERADLVNTVSPTFARESLQPEHGMGLDGVLRARGDRFFGILNGIDPELWNPATDPDLAAHYERADLTGKAACRRALLEAIGFDPSDDRAVLGAIGRLDPQKGFDLLAHVAGALVDRGARLVIQGSGDPRIMEPFHVLAGAHPDRVALIERFDRAMARRIYAGSDLFVMPSRFEPSGQGQMIALRYGTPPIVRSTGGLADSVVDVTAHPDDGTGFVFGPATPEALLQACRHAIAFRGDGRSSAWLQLVQRGMALDFSWESGPALRYMEAYRRALALRAMPG
jgi:starch synthase